MKTKTSLRNVSPGITKKTSTNTIGPGGQKPMRFAGCMIWFFLSFIIAFWTDRNLDFYFSYFKGEAVDIPYGLSWLASVFGPFSVGFNVLAELFRFVL